MCKALVEAGASISARDRWNRTPLAIAEKANPPDPALLRALTKATKKRLAELRQAEAAEGRYRSDMVEVRARGRFNRMARDEATRRVRSVACFPCLCQSPELCCQSQSCWCVPSCTASSEPPQRRSWVPTSAPRLIALVLGLQAWVERQVKAKELRLQEEKYWRLKSEEALALQEAEAAVRELEIEREVQHDLIKYRAKAHVMDDVETARGGMYNHRMTREPTGGPAVLRGRGRGGGGGIRYAGNGRGRGGGRRQGGAVQWDAVGASTRRSGGQYHRSPTSRAGGPPRPQPTRHHLPPLPQHAGYHREYEYGEYGPADAPYDDGLY